MVIEFIAICEGNLQVALTIQPFSHCNQTILMRSHSGAKQSRLTIAESISDTKGISSNQVTKQNIPYNIDRYVYQI